MEPHKAQVLRIPNTFCWHTRRALSIHNTATKQNKQKRLQSFLLQSLTKAKLTLRYILCFAHWFLPPALTAVYGNLPPSPLSTVHSTLLRSLGMNFKANAGGMMTEHPPRCHVLGTVSFSPKNNPVSFPWSGSLGFLFSVMGLRHTLQQASDPHETARPISPWFPRTGQLPTLTSAPEECQFLLHRKASWMTTILV